MEAAKATVLLSALSGLLGLLLLIGASIVVNDLRPGLDYCDDYFYNCAFDDIGAPTRFQISAAGASILAGSIQIVMALVVFCKRGMTSARIGMSTYATCLVLVFSGFAIAMSYESYFEVGEMDEPYKSRFLFFYIIMALDAVFTFCAIFVSKKYRAKPDIQSYVARGSPQTIYTTYPVVQIPGGQTYIYPVPPNGQYNSYPPPYQAMPVPNYQQYPQVYYNGQPQQQPVENHR